MPELHPHLDKVVADEQEKRRLDTLRRNRHDSALMQGICPYCTGMVITNWLGRMKCQSCGEKHKFIAPSWGQ